MIEPTPDETPAVRPRGRRLVKTVRILSLLDLVIVTLAVGVLWIVSERTWWGTLLTFLPRHAFLVAPILLLLVSLFADRRMIVVNLASLVLAAGPLMGGRIPLSIVAGNETPEQNLRIVSCNVQCFEPDFESVSAGNHELVTRRRRLSGGNRRDDAFTAIFSRLAGPAGGSISDRFALSSPSGGPVRYRGVSSPSERSLRPDRCAAGTVRLARSAPDDSPVWILETDPPLGPRWQRATQLSSVTPNGD